MPPMRLQHAIGIPKSLRTLPETRYNVPIGKFRAFTREAKRWEVNGKIAPGGGKCTNGKSGIHGERFRWQGWRRYISTKSDGRFIGTPKRSNAAGALAILFGASAVAFLAAPLASYVQERVDIIRHVDDEQEAQHIEDSHSDVQGTFRLSEVSQHDENNAQKWVISGTSVYDITDFIDCHPGGKVILRACGGSIDPFWQLFSIHQKPEVRKILDDYSIGEIDARDLKADGSINWTVLGKDANAVDDPFKDDPERCEELNILTAKPCNAETPGTLLADFITPLRLFFVRNHLWVPNIEPETHALQIELPDGEEVSWSIEDLKRKFESHSVTVTLQCAGNRRSHMNKAANGKTSGLGWDVGAIGTAEFKGARLRDVLVASGYDVDQKPCKDDEEADRHVHFCAPSDTYEQSIPIQSALSPTSDVLLAWEMNGETMPRDHGGPLRAIVPGSVATRSVKWLGKVRISCEESQSNWHTRDYKCFGPNKLKASDVTQEDWNAAESIQEFPIQSAITKISPSSATEPVSVQGFAYSGGGRRVVRVDVSADGGKTWKQACLRKDDAKGSKRWAWTLWDINWPKEEVSENAEFVVKAVDESHNCQPPTFDGIWNFRGLLANAWHRVPLGEKPVEA